MNRRTTGRIKGSVSLAAILAVGIAAIGQARPAHAQTPPPTPTTIGDVFGAVQTAFSVAQQLYSAVQWVDCKFGMSCPETDAHAQATRVITDTTTVVQTLNNNALVGAFKGLMDRSDVHFRNPRMGDATYDLEEVTIANDATDLFNQYEVKFQTTDETNPTSVIAAYNLTPYFIMMAALVDGIGKATLVHGRVSMDLLAINDRRTRTLRVLESLVGAQSLWYPCSSTEPVSSVATADRSFATRKLFRKFADSQFSLSSCDNNCNLARHFDAIPTNVCKRDCNFICIACFAANNADVVRITLPKAVAKMNRDPVVQSARADMEMLVKMGAMHNSALLWRQNIGAQANLMSVWDIWSNNSYRETKLSSPSPSVWQPVVTGDFNGDGYDDILWAARNAGVLATWDMKENQGVSTPPGGAGSLPGFMYSLTNKSKAFSGDIDGDGVSDVVFSTSKVDPLFGPQASFVTWFMQPGTVVPKMTSTSSTSTDSVQGLGNFDGDALRRSDVLFRSPLGGVTVGLNGGAPTAITSNGAAVGNVGLDWSIKDVGDFNGDKKADILWYNVNGQVAIWFMDGSKLLSGPAVTTVAPSSGWRIQGAADIDHDGISDIVWEQTKDLPHGGPISVWLMNSNATTRESTYELVPAGAQLIGFLRQGPAAPTNSPASPIPEAHCGFPSGTLRNPGFGAYETWQAGSTFDGGHGTLAGDVDGDGRAELVTLGNTVTGMSLSGNSFTAPRVLWNGPFYGNHGNFLADVDGDGFADLVGMGDGYIGMLPSLGPWHDGVPTFGDYKTLLSESGFGETGTLMGDFDGDGKADIIAVDQRGVVLRRSIGSSLAAAIRISGTPSWSPTSFLLDVTGDGKADLVHIGIGDISVRASTGTGLVAAQTWTPPTGFVVGLNGVTMGDVDGDGRADVIMPNNDHVSVFRSTGSSFGREEVWFSAGAFYGNHGNFAADFDGNARADLVGVGDGYVGALRSQ